MSTTTTTTVSTKAEHKNKPIARDLVASGRVAEQQWHKDLVRDGYAVVKGAVPRERAEGYVDEMYSWLEAFDLGFKRDDPSTIRKEHLPVINEKGMCMSYSVAHEDFVWRVRSEPGVIDAFATVYDDQDLIVSFDAVNFGFGNRKDLPPNKPWPHQDQDPTKPGFRCLQGLVNLLPNGPDDGGLIVCKGGYQLSEEFHEVFKDEAKIPAWTPEWYGFTENGMKWLADKGCEWVKVCAEPGDLLIWDSRTPHYNLSPTSDRPRFCIYTCYMPVADASQEDLLRKKAAFEDRMLTSHWPNATYVGRIPAKRDGAVCPYERERPTKEPQLDERAYKLTGIPYLKRLGHENDSAVIQLTAGA